MKILAEIVCEIEADQRLYDFCNGRFTELPSRKSVKNAIDQNRMLVNGKSEKTGFWLRGGERIQLVDLENKPSDAIVSLRSIWRFNQIRAFLIHLLVTFILHLLACMCMIKREVI